MSGKQLKNVLSSSGTSILMLSNMETDNMQPTKGIANMPLGTWFKSQSLGYSTNRKPSLEFKYLLNPCDEV